MELLAEVVVMDGRQINYSGQLPTIYLSVAGRYLHTVRWKMR